MARAYAARKSGQNNFSAVLKEVCVSPERPAKVRKLLNMTSMIKSPNEALTFILDNSLSKEVYVNMRLASKSSGADIWPPYNNVREAKTYLRPPKETIIVSDYVAEVPL